MEVGCVGLNFDLEFTNLHVQGQELREDENDCFQRARTNLTHTASQFFKTQTRYPDLQGES